MERLRPLKINPITRFTIWLNDRISPMDWRNYEPHYYKICAEVKTKIMAAHHCRPQSIMTHEPHKTAQDGFKIFWKWPSTKELPPLLQKNLLSPVVKLQLQTKTWSKTAFWNVPCVNAVKRNKRWLNSAGGPNPTIMHCGRQMVINILIYDNNIRDLERKKTIDASLSRFFYILFQANRKSYITLLSHSVRVLFAVKRS